MFKKISKLFRSFSEYGQLQAESDDLILRVTNVDPKRMPKVWRKEASRVLKDLHASERSEMNGASAAMVKLAFYCHGYEVIEDIPARSRIASAITVLRQSKEGALISTQASDFSYSFAGV